MSNNAPLKLEELIQLADEFFPSFNEIHSRMPAGASVRETLQVWDKIAELAVVKKKNADKPMRLGFKGSQSESSDQPSKSPVSYYDCWLD